MKKTLFTSIVFVSTVLLNLLNCKKNQDDAAGGTSVASSSVSATSSGGVGGSDAGTAGSDASTDSGTDSGSSGGLDAGSSVCRFTVCPEVIPVAGTPCDVALDQYCEYGSPVCLFASCSGGKGVWAVDVLNPCVCN